MNSEMNVKSLLASVSPADVMMEPYPHLIVENALDNAYYQALAQTFPEIEDLKCLMAGAKARFPDNKNYKRSLRHLNRRNRRVNIPSDLAMGSQYVADIWKNFINYHSSQEFFEEMISVFRSAINQYYPQFSIQNAQVARRGSSASRDVTMDAMIAMNTPSWLKGQITGPHTDHPNKLFVGLFYLKHQNDFGGGDLVIYRRKKAVTEKDIKWPRLDSVEPIKKVEYAPNSFVLLLNSVQSVHGVTHRRASKYPRRFVNLIAETKNLSDFA